MTKIAVIGSLVVDMAMRTPRVPRRGDNLHAHSFKMGAGGKGANAAAAIVRMDGAALLVGCVGDDDLGRFELAALQREGVDTAGVSAVQGAQTAVAFVMVDPGGENTILVANEANEWLTGAAVESALVPHWETLDAVLVNFEASEGAVAAAVRSGRAHGLPVVVDAGPIRQYSRDTWCQATVLSPNLPEAAALVGYPVQDDDSAWRAARELLAAGPQAVVVKRGAQGALLVTREEELVIPSFPVEVVDTTGAGDAFTAGLTLAIAEGRPLQEAARFASAAGALAVTRFGTLEAMPDRGQVDSMLARDEPSRQ